MPQFYTQNHGSSILNARMNAMQDVDDELNCREELAAMRSVQFDRMESYSDALETGDRGQIAVHGEMASEHANRIIVAAERVGKHEKNVRESITPELMRFLANQVFNLAYELFGELEVTTDFVAQAEAILCGGVSPQDIDENDLLAIMDGTVPLVAPENLAAIQEPIGDEGDADTLPEAG